MGVLGSSLDRIGALFDRRFLVAAFFPVLAFWTLTAVVILSTSGELGSVLRSLSEQQLSVTLLQAGGFLVWAAFTAAVIDSLELELLWLAQGYWGSSLGGWIADRGKRWHRARLEKLAGKSQAADSEEGRAAFESILNGYPPPDYSDLVMPTRLGNIFRSMELYPEHHYGLSGEVFWPRLYQLLPDRMNQGVGNAHSALNGTLVITFLAIAFVVVTGIYGL